jgi:hypothetical protein
MPVTRVTVKGTEETQLAKHCAEITLTPEGKGYRLNGEWNLVGF